MEIALSKELMGINKHVTRLTNLLGRDESASGYKSRPGCGTVRACKVDSGCFKLTEIERVDSVKFGNCANKSTQIHKIARKSYEPC